MGPGFAPATPADQRGVNGADRERRLNRLIAHRHPQTRVVLVQVSEPSKIHLLAIQIFQKLAMGCQWLRSCLGSRSGRINNSPLAQNRQTRLASATAGEVCGWLIYDIERT